MAEPTTLTLATPTPLPQRLLWQSGMTQSLNVAASATLVLGEAIRLRGVAAAEEVSILALYLHYTCSRIGVAGIGLYPSRYRSIP